MQESEISFVHIKAQNDYMLKATKKISLSWKIVAVTQKQRIFIKCN